MIYISFIYIGPNSIIREIILAMKVSASKSARQAKVCARVFHLCKSNTMYSCEYVAGWQIIRRAHMKIKYFVDSLK